MGYIYILSLIFLGITFILLKKSDKKLNLIKWICIFAVSILAYNITICMILGILHITQNIWLLSIINTAFGAVMLYKILKNKEIQKYKCSKMDIACFILICILFGVMFVKDLYIFKGDVTHYVRDSAIHYRAAKHYSENLQLFVFTEDKTFFNFNIMQTGSYINDGIFMNVMNSITGIDEIYLYQVFETIVLFMSGLAMYAFFADKIKTKTGLVGTFILFALYMYGYPYNSWLYGFSYLSVGITMVVFLLPVVEMLFCSNKIKKSIVISLILMTGMGLIFSYCLFVPAVFASICIYVFLEELKDKNAKKYLKFFGKNTLILTGALLVITVFGIGYLFVPSFIIEGQKNLVSALKEEGGIYPEKLLNFIPYLPFMAIFFGELIKRFKEKKLTYLDIFATCIIGYLALACIGKALNKVSLYYMVKIIFIVWSAVFAVTIDILNNNVNKKIFRAYPIALVVLLMIMLLAQTILLKPEELLNLKIIYQIIIALILIDALLPEFLPEKLKSFNKVTPVLYVVLVGVCISGWVWVKSGTIIGETQKHRLPNLVGMYYSENAEYRKANDLGSNFNSNNILVTKYARENLEDMTADNTILLTQNYYHTMWAMATLEYDGQNITFNEISNTTNQHNIKEAIANPNIKYIIRLDSRDDNRMLEGKESLQEIIDTEETEVLYSNENGYVAKINR